MPILNFTGALVDSGFSNTVRLLVASFFRSRFFSWKGELYALSPDGSLPTASSIGCNVHKPSVPEKTDPPLLSRNDPVGSSTWFPLGRFSFRRAARRAQSRTCRPALFAMPVSAPVVDRAPWPGREANRFRASRLRLQNATPDATFRRWSAWSAGGRRKRSIAEECRRRRGFPSYRARGGP